MKAVITVVGKDRVGILAMIANMCAEHQINILNVSQTIVDGIFTMTMIADVNALTLPLAEFSAKAKAFGEAKNLEIRVMNHDIFTSMHRI